MEQGITVFKAGVAAVCGALTALWGWFGWLVVAWVACMVIDYATGSAAAMKAGEWASGKAREGLWHKFGCIVAVLVSGLLDFVIGMLLDHVQVITLPWDYSVLLCPLVTAWYILTELGSIIENAGALGAPMPGFLKKAVAALKAGVDAAGDHSVDSDSGKEG